MVRKSGRVKISSRDRVAVGNILLRGKVGGGRVAVAAAEEAEAGRRRRRRDSSASRTASRDGQLLLLFLILLLFVQFLFVAIARFFAGFHTIPTL